ncbi:MAG: histidine kinase, partial [Nitrospinae bacterium]|nr:histidine kinase [Nitrospinota bacterium]
MKDFLYLLIFNTIIAIFLTVIGFGGDFEINLIFSQCIGISTFLCIKTTLYIKKTTAIVPQLLMITIAMTIGVILGTILGSTVNGIDPLFFFNEKTGMFLQVILIGIMFGSIVTYIFISREMLSNANAAMLEEKMKGIAGEKRVIETNLRLLQNQIEPHFLFNTLSNIMSLIDTDPEKAKSMMEDFIHFLRASLTKTRDQRITLGEEIEIIRSYLNIFKVRMGDRLRYKITVPDIL